MLRVVKHSSMEMRQRSATKIICTVGPASVDINTLEDMFLSGMSVVRLNMSHGTHDFHLRTIENVRAIEMKYKSKIFIALDTRGPETRISCSGPVCVKKNDVIQITTSNASGVKSKSSHLIVNLDSFENIDKSQSVTLDDSKLALKIQSIEGDCIRAVALNDHVIEDNKRVCFGYLSSKRPFLTQEDILDLKFANSNHLDAIFASFVEYSEDLLAIRKLIEDPTVQIVAKIESRVALGNLREIEDVSDAVMIARGDLMNDVGVGSLFSIQKTITSIITKPIIMATEMLYSMTESILPLRSEISDVGNAVVDGCAAVMLSSETAVGKHPPVVVDVMRTVCLDAERYLGIRDLEICVCASDQCRSLIFKRGVYFRTSGAC